jgi:hypothetical protein
MEERDRKCGEGGIEEPVGVGGVESGAETRDAVEKRADEELCECKEEGFRENGEGKECWNGNDPWEEVSGAGEEDGSEALEMGSKSSRESAWIFSSKKRRSEREISKAERASDFSSGLEP